MPKLHSSKHIVRILENKGFVFVSQRGSHVKYRRYGSPTLTVIITSEPKGNTAGDVPVNSSTGPVA